MAAWEEYRAQKRIIHDPPTAEELKERIAKLDEAQRHQLVARLRYEKEVRRTAWLCGVDMCKGTPHRTCPTKHARRDQRLPFTKSNRGKVAGVLYIPGRGWGKTRTGAEGVRSRVDKGLAQRVAFIGRTGADVRDTMLEGESGLLQAYPRWQRPVYVHSRREVKFHNGAMGKCYSSEEPDQLRGPQHDLAWADEVSTFYSLDLVMMNMWMGLRLGDDPRAILTGTPRPTKAMKKLVNHPGLIVVKGTTYDNLSNLSEVFKQTVVAQYEGTRMGKQELDGIMLSDVPGSLLKHEHFDYDGFRPVEAPTDFTTVVVAIDPAVTNETHSDATGISVCAIGEGGRVGYVLWSERRKDSPAGCMARAADLSDEYMADYVVAEVNNGGDYVKTTMHQLRPDIKVKSVHASKGKFTRAEPVAMLYEKHRIKHLGHPHIHAALEEEWTTWVPKGTTDADGMPIESGIDSPDVMDSVVWGLTDLMLPKSAPVTTRPTRTRT